LPEEALRTFPFAFQEGMISEARARILGDLGENAPEYWWWGQHQPDAALLVYGRSADAVASLQTVLLGIASQHGAELVKTIPLKEITKDKREAFGFVDGISQPVIRGTYKGIKEGESIHLVEPGEFILGYPDNRGGRPPGPILPATADTANLLPLIVTPEGFDRTMVETVRDLGCNGSFLVIRQLEQDREAFDAYCLEEAERLKYRLPPPYDATPEFIAAKMVGRWQDGSSLVRHPYESHTREKAKEQARRHPDHATGPATGHRTGHAPQPAEAANSPSSHNDNSFLFGTEDPEGLRCPFAAHVRRANPRDSFDPGSREQIDISNRHRIIRVGRQYAPAPGQKPGLLFMCLNGDIERQFEFVQQSWLLSPGFSGLSCEKDPLLGDGAQGECGFTIPNRDGPVRLAQVPRFIATRGGGYFFLPGKRLIDFLSTP
jgi:deferrochelatase/peroxidase EfeB